MNFEEFNLTELVQSVVRKFSRGITDKEVLVETNFCEPSAMVSGDPIRIEQVLVNLMSNAMKNIVNKGRLKVNITLQQRTQNAELSEEAGIVTTEYLVSIENEGKHIPDDELDKVWERFYKVDKSRTRELEGTGIGLSIVKNILRLHNSSFGAMNTQSGVEFFFTLKR